jgi:hypothetical protein
MSGERPRARWVMVVAEGVDPAEPRAHFHCERCGERFVTVYPIKAATFVAVSNGFIKAHQHCEARP